MNHSKTTIIILAVLVALILIVPYLASAAIDAKTICGDDPNTLGPTCLPKKPDTVKGYTSVGDVVKQIIDWALIFVGSVALIFVIIGGFKYLAANGNEEQVKSAKATIIRALVGLLIVIFAYAIVALVATVAAGNPTPPAPTP